MSIRMDVKQIHRRRLTEEIVDQLVSLIVNGKLKHGGKLPPERELMKQFGVGRSSLREAIGSLSLTGVLTVLPGSGTYVSVSQEEFLSKPLNWGIPMGRTRFKEVVEARHILEEAIAGLSAERAGEADIAEMKYQLTQMKDNRGNIHKSINADMSFHTALAKASHNILLLNSFLQIRNMLRSWMEEVRSVKGVYDLTYASALEEHGEILSAVEARNAERARSKMHRHLKSAASDLASVILTRTSSDTNP